MLDWIMFNKTENRIPIWMPEAPGCELASHQILIESSSCIKLHAEWAGAALVLSGNKDWSYGDFHD